jgi:hypothetical protein
MHDSPAAVAVPNAENLRLAYGQLCSSYQSIDDFRLRLLGLLPIGTGLFLVLPELGKNSTAANDFLHALSPSIGLFGLTIALGLFVLELYGIRKCTHLIMVGKHLERKLGVIGQFRRRAPGLFGYLSEPFAAGVIYPAVIAAWTSIGLQGIRPGLAHGWPLVVFGALFCLSIAFIGWLDQVDAPMLNAQLAAD